MRHNLRLANSLRAAWRRMPPSFRRTARNALKSPFKRPRASSNSRVPSTKAEWIKQQLQCPVCRAGPIIPSATTIDCDGCEASFPVSSQGTPVMITPEMRKRFNIEPTGNVSAHGYDNDCLAIINEVASLGGMVLDCGAGSKSDRFSNVVNLEIVDYPSTDVLAVGQALPFIDNCFDAVLSIAVLEHVNEPFICAEELMRVLKPGGQLFCAVPFLQPEHGYPDHYFNMTRSGVRRLFRGLGAIEKQFVPRTSHPAFALNWFLRSWEAGLSDAAKETFLDMRVKDFIDCDPHRFLTDAVGDLHEHTRWELACGTVTVVRKD